MGNRIGCGEGFQNETKIQMLKLIYLKLQKKTFMFSRILISYSENYQVPRHVFFYDIFSNKNDLRELRTSKIRFVDVDVGNPSSFGSTLEYPNIDINDFSNFSRGKSKKH